MATAGTGLGAEGITATQASYTFPSAGSWTPVSGEPVIVWVMSRKGTAADQPTSVTGTNGFNVTWTLITGLASGGSTLLRFDAYRGIPSSSTAGTLVVAYSASQLQCGLQATSCSDIDTTTDQGLVQFATDTGTNAEIGIDNLIFASALVTPNLVLAAAAARGTPTDWSAGPGFTGAGDAAFEVLGGVGGMGAVWDGDRTNETCALSLTSGSNFSAIAVELKGNAPAAALTLRRRLLLGVGI